MSKIKTKTKYFWYGLIAVCLGSLNAPIIKHASSSIDPLTINLVRFAFAALVTLPFFLHYQSKLTKKGFTYSLLSGIWLFIATFGFVNAVKLSTSSYVALLLLISPLSLVFFSIKLTKDKLKTSQIAGFSLAALGAILIIAGPMLITDNTEVSFYPKATLFISLTIIAYPIAIICARKANQSAKKLPITSVIFIQTSTIAVLNFAVGLLTDQINLSSVTSSQTSVIIAIIYSGIAVGVIDRCLNVISYEHVGSMVNGALVYLGIFITLLVSVLFLHEKLSLIAGLGGVVILLGVTLTEQNLSKRHRSSNHLRHH